MDLKGNTILITGGSSGIGLELAKRLAEHNKILICGRSSEKLQSAKYAVPSIEYLQCDLALKNEREKLFEWIKSEHSDTNVLINNAAITHNTNFVDDPEITEKAELEIAINYLAPVHLSKLFLPLLEKNKSPKLIYITTGLAYTPRVTYPIYCSTKAALHSFITGFRFKNANAKYGIIEVLMPAVDTPWHNGNPPKIAIPVEQAVQEMLSGLNKGNREIKIASVKKLYKISRLAPKLALKLINKLD